MLKRLERLRTLGFAPSAVLDIGANQGDWTRAVAVLFPRARFLMVEADPGHRPALSRLNHPHRIALLGAEAKEAVRFYTIDGCNTGASMYREQTSFYVEPIVKELPLQTLDDILEPGDRFDLVKLDVQGAELDVLRGGTRTLAGAELVLLEAAVLEYNQGAPGFHEVVAFMDAAGFQVLDVTELHFLPTGELIQIDLLFARRGSSWVLRGLLV